MMGAGDASFFGTYTYMPKLVGPSLNALTFVMPWQLPTAARAAKVVSVDRSFIFSIDRLLLARRVSECRYQRKGL